MQPLGTNRFQISYLLPPALNRNSRKNRPKRGVKAGVFGDLRVGFDAGGVEKAERKAAGARAAEGAIRGRRGKGGETTARRRRGRGWRGKGNGNGNGLDLNRKGRADG